MFQVGNNKILISSGEQAILDCRTIKGTPTPTIKFFKNDRELYSQPGLMIQEGGRLIIQVEIFWKITRKLRLQFF